MNWRPLALCTAALLIAAGAVNAEKALPIYIEDNHAGTFHWLAQNLDLDQQYTLLLFDAHSDASGIFDSDKIRDALRNVASLQDRQSLLDRWRRAGMVQCFNWIEPLMPAPIAKVIWIRGEKLSASETENLTKQATALLDGHLEAAPRKSGPLRDSYSSSGFDNLGKRLKPGEPLVVTIDLDYFSGLPAAQQEAGFNRIWDFVVQLQNLRAVTIAISRSYLKDDDEAYRLLKLALDSALSLPIAQIEFEPFLAVGNDRSNLARKLIAKGQKPSLFDIAQTPQELRARMLSERERIQVRHESARWQELLRTWDDEAPRLHLELKNHQCSTDNVWRVPANESAEIELIADPWITKPEKIEWFVLTPRYLRCNLTSLSTDQVGFVANAAPRPVWDELPLSRHDSMLPTVDIEKFFDPEWHCGSLRLRARAIVDGKIRETPVLELRRVFGHGFRASITEQFGLPYLFGIGELSENSNTGPETHLGADCANFVVYALRRQGWRVPWSDPKRLRHQLELAARSARPGTAKIATEDLERGSIVHLGTHVAAVLDDRQPLGILDQNDLVAHQLGGTPEIITLGKLLQDRKKNTFDLLRVPSEKSAATLVFGGDVMLGRSCAAKIEDGKDPFAGIDAVLRGASFAAANLECTLSGLGDPNPRYAFRAAKNSAQLLRRAGFHAMGLANNHALDFGAAALDDSVNYLFRQRIGAVGVQKDGTNAWSPSFFSLPNGEKIALIAISDVGPATSPQIATGSNRRALQVAIADARAQANFVACLVHWGIENSESVTNSQRELARWLIDHGVDLVVGSHPHCVQPLDFYHGRPIAYSLGNLVFDGAPTVTAWNRGALLQVRLDEKAQVSSANLIPVVLDDGFPHLDFSSSENSLTSR